MSRAFFGEYLKGKKSPLLSGPSPNIPKSPSKQTRNSWARRQCARFGFTGSSPPGKPRRVRSSDPHGLRHARQRQATPVLRRSLGDVCQEPQLPRSRRHGKVKSGRSGGGQTGVYPAGKGRFIPTRPLFWIRHCHVTWAGTVSGSTAWLLCSDSEAKFSAAVASIFAFAKTLTSTIPPGNENFRFSRRRFSSR